MTPVPLDTPHAVAFTETSPRWPGLWASQAYFVERNSLVFLSIYSMSEEPRSRCFKTPSTGACQVRECRLIHPWRAGLIIAARWHNRS